MNPVTRDTDLHLEVGFSRPAQGTHAPRRGNSRPRPRGFVEQPVSPF